MDCSEKQHIYVQREATQSILSLFRMILQFLCACKIYYELVGSLQMQHFLFYHLQSSEVTELLYH